MEIGKVVSLVNGHVNSQIFAHLYWNFVWSTNAITIKWQLPRTIIIIYKIDTYCLNRIFSLFVFGKHNRRTTTYCGIRYGNLNERVTIHKVFLCVFLYFCLPHQQCEVRKKDLLINKRGKVVDCGFSFSFLL